MPEAVSSPPAGDWLGLSTGLLLVANLFAAALEERTTACAELRGLVEFHHRSLKQSRQAHEDERDRWAGERAAAQADRESASRTIDALVAELAASRPNGMLKHARSLRYEPTWRRPPAGSSSSRRRSWTTPPDRPCPAEKPAARTLTFAADAAPFSGIPCDKPGGFCR